MQLGYEDLLEAVKFGRISGRWYVVPRQMRALIRASLEYTKNGVVIQSPYLLGKLVPVLDFLRNLGHTPSATVYGSGDEGSSTRLKEMILDVLDRLRRRPDARRKVPPLTRALLKAAVEAPVRFVSRPLLSMIAKSLKTVGEALSPRIRLVRTGLAVAWSVSMIACRWGNEEAVSWRRDEGFAMYWGAMLRSWPKFMQAPQPQSSRVTGHR